MSPPVKFSKNVSPYGMYLASSNFYNHVTLFNSSMACNQIIEIKLNLKTLI